MSKKKMQAFLQLVVDAAPGMPEEQIRHEAEREEKRRNLMRKRLYADLTKKGMTVEEVDERRRRLLEVMKRSHQ